jgi:hypothetical protein
LKHGFEGWNIGPNISNTEPQYVGVGHFSLNPNMESDHRLINISDAFDDLIEKIFGPYFQGAPVSNERGDFPTRLLHVEFINGLFKKVPESARRQRLVVLIVARLTHPGFEMTNPNFGITAPIPDP